VPAQNREVRAHVVHAATIAQEEQAPVQVGQAPPGRELCGCLWDGDTHHLQVVHPLLGRIHGDAPRSVEVVHQMGDHAHGLIGIRLLLRELGIERRTDEAIR
jgi:hypothetical protein